MVIAQIPNLGFGERCLFEGICHVTSQVVRRSKVPSEEAEIAVDDALKNYLSILCA